jgi:hypothetical protein
VLPSLAPEVPLATTLIHRGEQVRHTSDLGTFEAQCTWAWEGARRVYPIAIEVRSVRADGRQRLTPALKQQVAERMMAELETGEPGIRIVLA